VDQLKNIHNEEQARQAMSPADIAGYEPSYEFVKFMRSYAQFIMDEWTAGRTLTRPYWIAGVNYINPSAVHYTKPVLVLINHLDFSGGDFFPTILQDNKRVTIMGTRTAGAGGYVNDIRLPNNIGVAAFRVTESIATRIDGNPIENLGVTPDKVYEMTVEDYTQNYAPYVRAINATVNELLSGTKLP
jgi:C-terminal processing protease CtpA/Prc